MNEKNTLFNWFKLVLKRDLVLSFKKIATFMVPLVFFLIVITLFPLALGTEGSFPTFILVLAKVLAHWLVTGAPLLLASLISTFFLYLPEGLLFPLLISLLMGTLLLSLLGALGGALTIGKTAILSAVIVLPLSVPILILGVAVITSALNGQDFFSYLYFLGAMLAIGIPGLCLATTEAIVINYD